MHIMLAITMASLTLAAAMSAVAWRSFSADRRRSEARVRALADGIARAESHSGNSARSGGIDHENDARPATPSTGLFAALSAKSGPRVPGRAAGIAVASFVVIGSAALMVAREGPGHAGSSRPLAPAPRTAAVSPKPLELLALDHELSGDRLTVRGVVHNPSDAAAVQQLVPVVFVFDRNGGFVTSGRGTLDAATLGPGANSTFVVDVPDVADVGRYRVSFRTDDRVVAHVDRRSEIRN